MHTVTHRNRLFTRWVVGSVVACLLLLALTSCQSPDGAPPVEAQVFINGHDVNDRPPVFTHWDSDLFVWWTDANGVARVRGVASKIPLFERTIEANKAGASLRSKELEWSGVPGQPMPEWARRAFTDAEIVAWQLAFQVAP